MYHTFKFHLITFFSMLNHDLIRDNAQRNNTKGRILA